MSEVLGLSHVVGCVVDFDRSIAGLKSKGWPILFEDRDVPVQSVKRGLLAGKPTTHHVALAKPPAGPSVEFTAYFGSSANSAESGFDVLGGRSSELEPIVDGAGACRWRSGDGFTTDQSRIDGLFLRSSDPDASREFWRRATGAVPAGSDALELRAPHPALKVMFRFGVGETLTSHLDRPGWTCIALLVRDAWKAEAMFLAAGATPGFEPNLFHVGGRDLTVAMVRCPDGRIVELMAPPIKSMTAILR